MDLNHHSQAVPELRPKYLAAMYDIADTWWDWNRLGLIVERYRALIQPDVE
jgi:hypothetical protein